MFQLKILRLFFIILGMKCELFTVVTTAPYDVIPAYSPISFSLFPSLLTLSPFSSFAL